VDVAVIGGGIVGCALAAFLAEGGASVRLYEREEIAAGASGRNSGVLQHPFDAATAPLYVESLEHYRELEGFALAPAPTGLLIVSREPPATERFPELSPQYLEDAREAEPALAAGLYAVRYDTGHPVPPAAAARAFAARAEAAGAELRIGTPATVAIEDGRAVGVHAGGELRRADAVALAAGPWSPEVLGTGWAPIEPVWGVVVDVEIAAPPRHTIEESGIDALSEGAAGTLFSIVTARDISAVGSTFLSERPDPHEWAPRLLERGRRFVPGLAGVKARGVRACARPVSVDGRPFLGPLLDGLVVASGHGPWGISLGPASARLVADGLLGRAVEIPPEVAATRPLPAAR
jgi:glycine/D-amino acid oxidase-like deaminating enzyme